MSPIVNQYPQSIERSRERCQNKKQLTLFKFLRCLSLGDEVVNNLGMIYGIGMVDGMLRAGSNYNLGPSRWPDKIGSRAVPARGPCLARRWDL